MRKICHGLIAIAFLGGPASLILAHQKLTETWPQEASRPADGATLVQQAYSRCSEAPQPIRSSQCEDYIRSFDRCTARKNNCDPRPAEEVFRKLNLSPAQQEGPPPLAPL
jgi:hypothetical protein